MHRLFASVIAVLSGTSSVLATVIIPTVPVGNAGNAPDSTGFGAVGYDYRMGTFEITAGQYTEFLNAVAATDTFALYNASMASTSAGCRIARAGASGAFSYSVPADYANRPVNFVSWGDAARFANWMHNGQPSGAQGLSTTESGSYFLNGVADSALNTITRSANATWVIPSEDEWYKSAYHRNNGTGAFYWVFATASDTTPGKNLADPAGNNANYGPNPATPIDGGIYWTTLAGEFQNSASSYGTFDQSGNVAEWTEARSGTGTLRVLRGGSYLAGAVVMSSANRATAASGGGGQSSNGFRLGYIPAPSTAVILAMSGLGLVRRRR